MATVLPLLAHEPELDQEQPAWYRFVMNISVRTVHKMYATKFGWAVEDFVR
jgi:hypothetical protein